MNYFRYYRLINLQIFTKKNLLFSAIFAFSFIYISNLFFNEGGSFSLTLSGVFILSVFATSMVAYQRKFEISSPIYQFPLTERDRVKYEYAMVFIIFILMYIIVLLFALTLLGIFSIFDTVNVSEEVTVESNLWVDAYSIGYHLLIFACVMPLSYIKSTQRKYMVGVLTVVVAFGLNLIIFAFSDSGIDFSQSLSSIIFQLPYYQYWTIGFLVLSIYSIDLSFRKSLRINAY